MTNNIKINVTYGGGIVADIIEITSAQAVKVLQNEGIARHGLMLEILDGLKLAVQLGAPEEINEE